MVYYIFFCNLSIRCISSANSLKMSHFSPIFLIVKLLQSSSFNSAAHGISGLHGLWGRPLFHRAELSWSTRQQVALEVALCARGAMRVDIYRVRLEAVWRLKQPQLSREDKVYSDDCSRSTMKARLKCLSATVLQFDGGWGCYYCLVVYPVRPIYFPLQMVDSNLKAFKSRFWSLSIIYLKVRNVDLKKYSQDINLKLFYWLRVCTISFFQGAWAIVQCIFPALLKTIHLLTTKKILIDKNHYLSSIVI